MKKIEFIFQVDISQGGYVCTKIERQAKLGLVREVLCKHFGGFSETKVSGGWYDQESDTLVMGKSRCFTIYTSLANNTLSVANALAKDFAVMFDQKTVLLTVSPVEINFVFQD